MSENNVIVVLMLSLLTVVVLVGLSLVLFAVRWHRRWELSQGDDRMSPRLRSGVPGLRSPPRNRRGLPRTWLAIHTSNLTAVQRVIALDDPKPCAWTDALAEEASRRLFVSPPVAGWILVTGSELPEPSGDIDACFRFLVELSRQLGQVQYFHQDFRTLHHAWARLDAGRVRRAYAWVEQTVWNQGAATAAEQELCMQLSEYGEEAPAARGSMAMDIRANLKRMPQLAARWSIDPTAIGARFWSAHLGISGEFTVPRLL